MCAAPHTDKNCREKAGDQVGRGEGRGRDNHGNKGRNRVQGRHALDLAAGQGLIGLGQEAGAGVGGIGVASPRCTSRPKCTWNVRLLSGVGMWILWRVAREGVAHTLVQLTLNFCFIAPFYPLCTLP